MNDEIDYEALDAYLMSDESPEDCMMLSDMDGFLHGIACSPEVVPSEEWMNKIFASLPADVPGWVLAMVGLRYTQILKNLTRNPPVVEPIFWQASEGHVIAMDWCEGFMDAVALRPKAWLRLTESGSHGHLITPIMAHLLDDSGNSALGIPQEELDQSLAEAAEQIPDAIVGIHQFWASKTKD